MLDSDKREFKELMVATMNMYQQEISVDVLRMWWGLMANYELSQIREAINRHMLDKSAGQFTIKPAHISFHISEMNPDGRIGAEEAWAIYPHNEYASAVITDEMSEAMQIAQELINEGDSIGARMAFKEAYNRITSTNKFNGIAPKWFASLGIDKAGREQAIKQAVAKGRISQDYATSLLPAPIHSSIASAISEVKFLTSKNVEVIDKKKEKSRNRIEEIKAMLAKG